MKNKGRRILMLLLVVIMAAEVTAPAKRADAAAGRTELTSNSDGTVTVKHDNSTGVNTKVLVIKDGKQYQYDLAKGKNNVRIPLTLGNGTYSVMVCKWVRGNQYAPVTQKNMKLKLNPSRAAFKPTHMIINFKNKNKAVKKAKSLTKKCKNKEEKITVIWKYLVNNYSYDYAKQRKLSSMTVQYIPNVDGTFKARKGICYDMAALYAAMLRSVGIEAKLETGYSRKVDGYHAWNRVYNSETKKWYIIDCTYDMCRRKQKRSYGMKKSKKDYSSIVYLY